MHIYTCIYICICRCMCSHGCDQTLHCVPDKSFKADLKPEKAYVYMSGFVVSYYRYSKRGSTCDHGG